MSDKEQPVEEKTEAEKDNQAGASVRKGGLFIILLILLSLVWYLLSDRFTPYTSQARVQGYVVGVAPKVAGVVTQVWVRNNQEVEKGQRLFEIDSSQYEIALESAESNLENGSFKFRIPVSHPFPRTNAGNHGFFQIDKHASIAECQMTEFRLCAVLDPFIPLTQILEE